MEGFIDYERKELNTLDNLMEGYQLIGFDWRYLYVNKSVIKQSKYNSRQDLVGYTMMEKYPGIEHTPLFIVLGECMKERVSRNIENEFKFPDGSVGYFELRIQPVPEGIFILSMDISERKKTEQVKEDHINTLEQMLFMTSHKVRQPIAHILGFSKLLDKNDISEEDLFKVIEYMKESAVVLDDFTRELTNFMHTQRLKVIEGM